MSTQPIPDQFSDPNTGVSDSHNVISFPNSNATLSLPKSLSPDQTNSIAAKYNELSQKAVNTATDAVGSAWDEVKNQGKGLKQMFQPPAATDPSDEKHVALLGPVSLQAYRMGKQAVSAIAASHLANQQGEGVIGSNLAMYEKMPMIGDIVQLLEQGKATRGIARGLTRAALMKGTADLSSSAIAKLAPEAEALAQAHPAYDISAQRNAAKAGFAKTEGGLNPTESVPKISTPNLKPVGHDIDVTPVEPSSAEQILAKAFMRRQRMEGPSGVENQATTEGETTTGVANIGGKTIRTGGVEAEPSSAVDEQAVRDFIRQTYGDKVADRVSLADEEKAVPATQAEVKAAAQKHIAELIKVAAKSSPDEVDILHGIRKRMGLEPQKVSWEAPTPEETAVMRERAGARYQYNKSEGDVNVHSVKVDNAAGKNIGGVTAREDTVNEPGIWRIYSADVTATKGSHVGRTAYSKMLDAAQKEATATGKEVTVTGDAVQSPAAQSTWDSLAKEYKVRFDKDDRPSVVFSPKPKKTSMPASPDFPLPRGGSDTGFIGRTMKDVEKRVPLEKAPTEYDLTGNWASAITER